MKTHAPSAVDLLRQIEAQGLELCTRMGEGKRILVAKPTHKVSPKIRAQIQGSLDDLIELVRFRETEEEKREAAEGLRIISEALLGQGVDTPPVLIFEESERAAAYEDGKLPLTLAEIKALAFATAKIIAAAARTLRTFKGDLQA